MIGFLVIDMIDRFLLMRFLVRDTRVGVSVFLFL